MAETGLWLQTRSGRTWRYEAPRAEDVCIEDIACALSRICRFNGHTRRFYSVAQHCVLVSDAVDEHLHNPNVPKAWARLVALLHDAAEAYLGDVVRPLKRHWPRFAGLERRALIAIGQALGVPNLAAAAQADWLKELDDRALATEARLLMEGPLEAMGISAAPLNEIRLLLSNATGCAWDPDTGYELFKATYQKLAGAFARERLENGKEIQ